MKNSAKSSLRRGFKSEAEVIALELRREIGLSAYVPLDFFRLAEHLGIPVVSIDEARVAGLSARAAECLTDPSQRFDAVTVCVGTICLVVYNSQLAPTRLASTISHEISHIVLDHSLGPSIGIGGCRHWEDRVENEAAWLSGALLVPRDGAFWWMAQDRTMEAGARHFGVSGSLFDWRANQTGVILQLNHRRAAVRV